MWQSFINLIAECANGLLMLAVFFTFSTIFVILAGLVGLGEMHILLWKQYKKQPDFGYGVIFGIGLAAIIFGFLHANHKLTIFTGPW